MLHVVIEKGNKSLIFSEILKKLKIFTDNVVIQFNDEYMYIQGMDSSHIVIFELKLCKEWFDTYIITKENTYEFGINTNIISKILSVRDENQHIRLLQDDDDSDKLSIEFINQNNAQKNKSENDKKTKISSCYEKFFNIPLVDIDVEMFEIPPTDYDATLQLESKNMKNLIDDFALFDVSTLDFTFNQDDISLKTNGIETNMEVNILHEQMELYSITENTEFKNSFNLNFIHKICQFSKISKIVQLQQTKDIPLEFTYMIDDVNIFRFYLAPSINDDDDNN
jgi:proliferating cell nuclear antigen PCNA